MDELLTQSLWCIRAHQKKKFGDRTLIDVFNRLLAKQFRPATWTPHTHYTATEDLIRSRQERWTTNQLAALQPSHPSTEGADFECPIVVAEYGGGQRILDGNHRVNRWKERGDTRLHLVNIHSIDGELNHVELPSAA